MINMDELWEYDTQSNTDVLDELTRLEVEHEIISKEKGERERKQHLSEGNDTDVYATQEAPTEPRQDNTAASAEAPENPEAQLKEKVEAKSYEKAEQHKNKTGGGSSADSNATVVPGIQQGDRGKTTYNMGRNDNLFRHVMGKIWCVSIKESDKNTFERVRQIKQALSIFNTEDELLTYINEYIDYGHILYEETFFFLTAIYKYDLKYYRNLKSYVFDHNNRYGKALDDFVKSLPKQKSKENHS